MANAMFMGLGLVGFLVVALLATLAYFYFMPNHLPGALSFLKPLYEMMGVDFGGTTSAP